MYKYNIYIKLKNADANKHIQISFVYTQLDLVVDSEI